MTLKQLYMTPLVDIRIQFLSLTSINIRANKVEEFTNATWLQVLHSAKLNKHAWLL